MSLFTPPSPPTDNLYKFVAISGVVLLIGAPVYWTSYELQLQERETEAWASLIKQVSVPGEYFFPPKADGTPEAAKAHEKWEALKRIVDAQEADNFRIRRRLHDLERFEVLVTTLAWTFGMLGLFLSMLGFRLWYVRVQRPQDRLLLKQAAETQDHGAAPTSPLPNSGAKSDHADQ
jgi:hypothetical protein